MTILHEESARSMYTVKDLIYSITLYRVFDTVTLSYQDPPPLPTPSRSLNLSITGPVQDDLIGQISRQVHNIRCFHWSNSYTVHTKESLIGPVPRLCLPSGFVIGLSPRLLSTPPVSLIGRTDDTSHVLASKQAKAGFFVLPVFVLP